MKQMKEIIKPDVLFIKLSGAGELDGYEGNVYKEELVEELCDKIDTKDKIIEVAVKLLKERYSVKLMSFHFDDWLNDVGNLLTQIEAMKGKE